MSRYAGKVLVEIQWKTFVVNFCREKLTTERKNVNNGTTFELAGFEKSFAAIHALFG